MTTNAQNGETSRPPFARRLLRSSAVPLLSIFASLLIGAIIIVITAESPLIGLEKVGKGYWGIVDGAFLSSRGLINTLVATGPLILTGLAVAIPFRAGLFNIGAEGQFVMGALFGTVVGIYLPGNVFLPGTNIGIYVPMPAVIHPIAVMVAGFVGGMLWGAIPGLLKALLNSHEVINTIMLNFIGIALVNFMVRNPLKDPNPSTVQTEPLRETAQLARIIEGQRLHLGFFIALLMAGLAYYFLFRTTWGFSLRTTGQNPNAAEYAGIRPRWEYVFSMMLGGGLAGLAGILEVQGLTRVLTEGFASGYGFDAIAVTLLAGNNPLAIIPASLVFGALTIGGDFLQIRAGLSVHIVSILRALILLFVSAPTIIRTLFRVPVEAGEPEGAPLTRGWGG
jgi:ABC-type uncharacterized transport system permease subunit